jgi:protein tyrosine/serine phosphatase
MDTIFRGDLATFRGRLVAWVDCLLIDHGLFRLVWSNFGTVAPGRLYRCNHPPPFRLAALTRRLGLRTLINLRGATGNGADALSREAAARLGLVFIDVPMQSGRAPRRDEILGLHAIYRSMQEPALVHCKSGADRAGLAAGLFVLFAGGRVAEAERQLALRFGHFAHSRAGVVDAFFRRYQQDAEGRKPFLDWVEHDYDPASLAQKVRPRRFADFLHHRVLGRE